MIRVNLLPQKKDTKRGAVGGGLGITVGEGGQAWLLIVAGVLVLEIVGLILFHKSKQDDLDRIVHKNQQVESSINEIEKQISNHAQIKAELKELKDREDAISKLQAARTGPTSTMLELSHVLTAGRGPTADRDKIEQLKRDNPGAVPNLNWDPRRLWLTNYAENDRTVRLTGLARDGEDVSEFLRRLALSDFFFDVRLLPAQKTVDPVTHLELVKFELSAKVRY
jgi:type IV pilus assembly protein PilN